MNRRQRLIVAAIGAAILSSGVLGGVVVARVRSDGERIRAARSYTQALRQRNEALMQIEIAQALAPVTAELRRLDEAMEAGRLDEAAAAWRDAYVAAIRSRRWEGMADVGDAAVKIARHPSAPRLDYASARQSYLAAFLRAREYDSLDGVLRAAKAFAGLGDRAVADQCLDVARQIAKADPAGLARVDDVAGR